MSTPDDGPYRKLAGARLEEPERRLESGIILKIADGDTTYVFRAVGSGEMRFKLVEPGSGRFNSGRETLKSYGADELWELDNEGARTIALYVKKVPGGREIARIEQDMFE